MPKPKPQSSNKWTRVHNMVRLIPPGQVASYGMIATLLPGVTARMVGYAMSATPEGQAIPWQRVINSRGAISPRPGAERQKQLLEDEGVQFSKAGLIKWADCVWEGLTPEQAQALGYEFEDYLMIRAGWPG